MDKKKQIEEMTLEIAKLFCNPKGCYNCNLCDVYGSLELSCEEYLSYRRMASVLYAAGYRKQSGWISVDERLPERQCSVLAYYGFKREGDDDLGYMLMGVIEYYAFDPNPHFQHESVGLRVTHWMPLPEAPKGE